MSNRNRKRGAKHAGKPHQHRGRRGSARGGRRRNDSAGFWGDTEAVPDVGGGVRITEDPAAVVRSLGAPPLTGHEHIAEHYFTAVYDQAVLLAGALAAAGGLIEPEELLEDRGE